jgi:N utilization substance protein B
MQILYQEDLVPRGIDEVLEAFEREHGFELPPYTRVLVVGVVTDHEQLDDEIEARLKQDWSLDRLGAVERNIMRMAMWELTAEASDVPMEVAIDEAVELARRYASPEAAKLVNGVLGSWARDNAAGGEGSS